MNCQLYNSLNILACTYDKTVILKNSSADRAHIKYWNEAGKQHPQSNCEEDILVEKSLCS